MPKRGSQPPERGFSLVELMIAIAIGLIILATLVSLFVSQSRARSELDKANRMIENGRYALELLSDNLRLAGFFGELDPATTGAAAGITDPCSTNAADMAGAVRLHVGGYDAATPTSVVASMPCGLVSSSLKTGSDIFVVRRADTSIPVLQGAALTGTHYLQVSLCRYDAVKFRVSTDPAALTLRGRDCTETSTIPYANVRRFFAQTYFVSPNHKGSDGIPTLMRKELNPDGDGTFVTTPLVEGIEYLQVEYGIDGFDTDADGMPDRFNPPDSDGLHGDIDGSADAYSTCAACSVDQWSNVVSAKLYVVARNIEPTPAYIDTKTYSLGQAGNVGPFNDNYKRHAYSQLVRLVNPSSRKEVP